MHSANPRVFACEQIKLRLCLDVVGFTSIYIGGAICIIVGAAAPTKKIKNSDKYQIFTIFAPINYKVLHPKGKRTLLKFILAPPLSIHMY
jgi:hypothetical protein